jgi:hypothetical protein
MQPDLLCRIHTTFNSLILLREVISHLIPPHPCGEGTRSDGDSPRSFRRSPLRHPTLPCLHRDRHAREAQEHALAQERLQQALCEHVLKRRTWGGLGPRLWRNRSDIENCEAETHTKPKFGRLQPQRPRVSTLAAVSVVVIFWKPHVALRDQTGWLGI